jgi:hypothetical protein
MNTVLLFLCPLSRRFLSLLKITSTYGPLTILNYWCTFPLYICVVLKNQASEWSSHRDCWPEGAGLSFVQSFGCNSSFSNVPFHVWRTVLTDRTFFLHFGWVSCMSSLISRSLWHTTGLSLLAQTLRPPFERCTPILFSRSGSGMQILLYDPLPALAALVG